MTDLPESFQKYTPEQIEAGLDQITADLILHNALNKLRTATRKNRATLLIPAEAQAILDHITALEYFRKGAAAAIDLVLASLDKETQS